MSVQSDVEEMEPTLQLWIDRAASAASVRCAGTLDAKTGHHVLDAVAEVLDRQTRRVTLDASDLRVVDPEGMRTLARAQRTVREGGALLVWRAPNGSHVRGLERRGHQPSETEPGLVAPQYQAKAG